VKECCGLGEALGVWHLRRTGYTSSDAASTLPWLIALADRCPWFHSKQYHSPMVCWSWVETRAYRPTRSSVWVLR